MAMAPAHPISSDLYNLRWNSYYVNLSQIVWEHKSDETLVDVTISTEGQFIKAHKLILSACSQYFQKIFKHHKSSDLLIVLNNVKFKDLQLLVQFMYKGEIKVAEADIQGFLELAKSLEIKGLSTLDYPGAPQPTQKSEQSKSLNQNQPDTKLPTTISVPLPSPVPQLPPPKKRKTAPTPSTPETQKILKTTDTTLPAKENLNYAHNHIPRPPNAFMIFANQWRKKLAVEFPTYSNKTISVKLGNMWKNLEQATKEAFYEDARKAEEQHKLKYPGYHYSPREARHRKTMGTNTSSKGIINLDPNELMDDDLVETKSEGENA